MISSWKGIRNRHKGETCLVIGNGPSLKDIPIDFLDYYPSFGTNRIYMLGDFTPTYYAAVNPLVIQQFSDDMKDMNCEKFISAYYAAELVTDAHPLYSSVVPEFSRNPEAWVYEGYTVTFVCLQLAFYMGFSTVLLVGVDHKYEFDGMPNELKMVVGDDPNHFDRDYFGDGRLWHLPDLVQSERAYKMAKNAFEMEGRKIVNLTPGSALDVFEKEDISEW